MRSKSCISIDLNVFGNPKTFFQKGFWQGPGQSPETNPQKEDKSYD
jgi:hypothetical protein